EDGSYVRARITLQRPRSLLRTPEASRSTRRSRAPSGERWLIEVWWTTSAGSCTACFCAQGLTEVQVEGRVALGSAAATAEVARLMVEQLRHEIVNAQYVTEAEIDAYVALLRHPAFFAVGMTLFAV